MGRLGSDSPARLRRMALDTAATASSWPTTRAWRASSMRTSFSTSPSSNRVTGTPVHRLTTSATSSASTSSFRNRCARCSSSRSGGGLLDLALEVGELAVA